MAQLETSEVFRKLQTPPDQHPGFVEIPEARRDVGIQALLGSAENKYNIKVDIGNYLSNYFHKLGLAILKKENFNFPIKDDHINFEFIKYLPTYLEYNYDDIYNEFIKNNITFDYLSKIQNVALWFVNDDRIFHFWNSIKNLGHTILDDAFKKSNLFIKHNNPIIHFRCADAPFIRHFMYHFPKYEFYKNALEKIYAESNNGNNINISKEIIILSCNDHFADNKMKISCKKYSDLLVNYLDKNSYNSKIECNAQLVDLAKIFYAPAVISTVSSFSFIPGFLGKGIFITLDHMLEEDSKKKCKVCNGWMLEGKIKHGDITDYHNIDEVEKILESKI